MAIHAFELLHNISAVKDNYLANHQKNVSRISVLTAEYIGLNNELKNIVQTSALFHDIGKINIPNSILFKPTDLTDREWVIMKQHPITGAEIFHLEKHKDNPDFSSVVRVILHHHERWDGEGYPYGLKGENIPLGSRIIAITDAFDAMTTDRPYRKRMSTEEACQEILKCAAKQFDPYLVERFIEIIRDLY
ncbi:MAG: HD-GYP domain-containing protein [Bacillota bacterium]